MAGSESWCGETKNFSKVILSVMEEREKEQGWHFDLADEVLLKITLTLIAIKNRYETVKKK